MAAKVIYYYGTVNSSKTMSLLAIGHNYESAGFNVIAIKPALDTRSELIETRAQIPPRKPDIVLQLDESIYDYNDIVSDADVILVDECQFLSEAQIDELRNLSIKNNIDILCFGLRTDSNTKLFPAAKRLFELADEIVEVKTICQVCGKHASFNKKVVYSKSDSSNIDPGWDNFQAVCYQHFLD